MSGAMLLPADALLVLAVLGVRPGSAAGLRDRLLAQAALLGCCLLLRLAQTGSWVAAWALPALLIEAGLLLRRGAAPVPAGRPATWLLPAALLLAWLSFRLLAGASLPADGRGVLSAALAVVACGALSALTAGHETPRAAGLLTAGHGLLLGVGAVAGPGLVALLTAVVLQGWALAALLRRPVWAEPE